MEPRNVVFFDSPAKFRRWLERYHTRKDELWAGYHRKATGRPTITWPESVDEALCFGWIDGIRKPIDQERYTIRFTPRRKGSVWSALNIRNVQRLRRAGRMHANGMKAFQERVERRCEIYSYEQRPRELPPALASKVRRNKKAWLYFQAQPPGYRRRIIWWLISARKHETRDQRLKSLIAASAKGKRLE